MAKEMIREIKVSAMKLHVKVTASCIEEGQCRLPCRCGQERQA
jgi:hypothetical protein